MADRYFKYKQALARKNHHFDIGIPVFHYLQPRSMSDKHFVNKIISLHPEKFIKFYEHHLDYYFNIESGRTEEQFFKKVVYVCQNSIQDFKAKAFMSRSYIWDDKRRYEKYAESIERFLEKLRERDEWGIMDTESEQLIRLRNEIKKLKRQLNELKINPDYKINLKQCSKDSIIHLLHDLQIKKHPVSKQEILITTSHNTWAKIISNHFTEDGNEIPFETAKNYFGETRITEPKESDRIFKIADNI